MTLQLVTFIYDIFLYAKCYVIHIVLDRIKSNQIKSKSIDEKLISCQLSLSDKKKFIWTSLSVRQTGTTMEISF